MNENFENTAEQAAAFQKIWTDTMSKAMLALFTTSTDAPPPEMLRRIRAGIFQALAESWDQFMRSPQFLETMKQWMDSAVSFRRITNDFMARVRSDTQSPSRDDIDTIMLTVRHMEKRLLDRIDELAAKVALLNHDHPAAAQRAARPAKRKAAAGAAKPRRTPQSRHPI